MPIRSLLALSPLVAALGLLCAGCGQPQSRPAATQEHRRWMDFRLAIDDPGDRVSPRSSLAFIDHEVGERLGIPEDKRACGILDLKTLRLELVRPDALFYGASVPKICILLAYFETHPEAATSLDPQVRRELELMIKRSSNEIAARYSRQVGLETIQRIQTSEKYRLYDVEHGGGLWCGKHYGSPEPRTGDPVGDLSHTATVRQCLRYFLMLEQGRLVNPQVSGVLREIFDAPGLEFHDDNFVAGLRGRNVHMIRKNGLWEDWHLDAARIERGDDLYLIVGMAHHPRGGEYLRQLSAEVDERIFGGVERTRFRHRLVHLDTVTPLVADGTERVLRTSPVTIDAPIAFNEALVSWNIDVPDGCGFTVEIRVGRHAVDGWSPFLEVGEWGEVPADRSRKTAFSAGKIDVDYFRSRTRQDRAQIRVNIFAPDGLDLDDTARRARIDRLAVCFSDMTGLPTAGSPPPHGRGRPLPPSRYERKLDVTFRSQTKVPRIGKRVCSPTSLGMLLEYRGVDLPTTHVAAVAYDDAHDIYGNWPRSVQAAYTLGVPGYLTRFSDWHEVEESIAGDQPLIISVRVAEGQLRGAPYSSTTGHLLVVRGFAEDGSVEVNDPAAPDAAKGQVRYSRADLEKVWLDRGGTAYVLLPPNAADDEL